MKVAILVIFVFPWWSVCRLLLMRCRRRRPRMQALQEKIAAPADTNTSSGDKNKGADPEVRAFRMTVAAGLGGSGDDQSSLIQRSDRNRRDQSQRGDGGQ